MLGRSGTWLARGQTNTEDEAKFVAQSVQLLKLLLCYMWSGTVVKNWALSVDQCQLQGLQFSVPFINLLSIFLRGNAFARIQKVVVDKTAVHHQTVTWWDFDECSALEVLCSFLGSNHWAGCCQLSSKTHFPSSVTVWLRNGSPLLHRIREDNTSKWHFFWVSQLMRHPLIKLFHLSNLLQMLNYHRRVDAEFFSNFCSC